MLTSERHPFVLFYIKHRWKLAYIKWLRTEQQHTDKSAAVKD